MHLRHYSRLSRRHVILGTRSCTGGYRIGPGERGKAQKAVDTGRWLFNWFENDDARRNIREKRIAFRSLGRDLTAGIFSPKITPDGVLLSPIQAAPGFGGPPKKGC